ncbi:MAG: flavodoxin family protein [candidate division Zixibacteria bacterium]
MNILGISGSPTGGSSTDILVNTILEGATANQVKTRFVRLNDKNILPCQSCGKSPEPDYCFFHDDMDELYGLMEKSEGIVLGSPIYFDSVSAQTKLFIDRTNCLRPVDFSIKDETVFKKPLFKGKKGGIVIVGGKQGSFDTTLRTARGFFLWAGMDIVFELKYIASGLRAGEARHDDATLKKARQCGKELLAAIQSKK